MDETGLSPSQRRGERGRELTKSELVLAVAEKMNGMKKKDVEAVVETVFDCMTDSLCRDERVEIRGWGSFSVRNREARKGRNPKTGDPVEVPRKRVPFFTAGKELKERVDLTREPRSLMDSPEAAAERPAAAETPAGGMPGAPGGAPGPGSGKSG